MTRVHAPFPRRSTCPRSSARSSRSGSEHDTFAKSRRAQPPAPRPWTFYEGPPTANGRPGTHHVEARVFKDVFPRFRTMQGYHVDRKAGWDCHGLPVELAVEKELGFSGKGDIEAYGIAEFNAQCRESVLRHVDVFEADDRADGLLGRHGAALPDHGRRVRRVGLVVAQADPRQGSARRGLPRRAVLPALRHRPVRPRARPGLRDRHRPVGLRPVPADLRPARRPGARCSSGRRRRGRWSPTPRSRSTPTSTYVVATDGERDARRRRAAGRAGARRGLDRSSDRFTGADMERWTYAAPVRAGRVPGRRRPGPAGARTSSCSPTTSPPRTAPAWCTSPPPSARRTWRSCRALRAAGRQPGPARRPLRRRRRRWSAASSSSTPTPTWSRDLDARGLLFRHVRLRALLPALLALPHGAALLRPAVLVHPHHRSVKDALLRENERTNWYPDDDQEGPLRRLAEQQHRLGAVPQPLLGHAAADLALRRGPPDLRRLAGRAGRADRHRPVRARPAPPVRRRRHLRLPGRRLRPGRPRRVPEVIDAWFDSGSMPFAQWGYPHVEGSAEQFEQAYPADFICEAIDQTRGWFYTLMAVGTLVFDRVVVRERASASGHILAEDGRKMSKHLGNILEPMPLMDEHGADAVRWFMAAVGLAVGGPPGRAHHPAGDRPQGAADLLEHGRLPGALRPHHRLDTRRSTAPPVADRPVLDRWALSRGAPAGPRGHRGAGELRHPAGRHAARGVRRRPVQLVRPPLAAPLLGRRPGGAATLHECLRRRDPAAGPADAVRHRAGVAGRVPVDDPTSCPSRCTWRAGRASTTRWSTTDLAAQDGAGPPARRARPGRARRRQGQDPAAAAPRPGRRRRRATGSASELRAEVAEELNVGARRAALLRRADLVDHTAKGNFRALGKRFGKQTPAGRRRDRGRRRRRAGRDARGRAAARRVDVDGEPVEVLPDEVIVSERPREGWSVVNEQGETVALDLELTPELRRAGLAREVVRTGPGGPQDQRLRGLRPDRAELGTPTGRTSVREALREHRELIAARGARRRRSPRPRRADGDSSTPTPTWAGLHRRPGLSRGLAWRAACSALARRWCSALARRGLAESRGWRRLVAGGGQVAAARRCRRAPASCSSK